MGVIRIRLVIAEYNCMRRVSGGLLKTWQTHKCWQR